MRTRIQGSLPRIFLQMAPPLNLEDVRSWERAEPTHSFTKQGKMDRRSISVATRKCRGPLPAEAPESLFCFLDSWRRHTAKTLQGLGLVLMWMTGNDTHTTFTKPSVSSSELLENCPEDMADEKTQWQSGYTSKGIYFEGPAPHAPLLGSHFTGVCSNWNNYSSSWLGLEIECAPTCSYGNTSNHFLNWMFISPAFEGLWM